MNTFPIDEMNQFISEMNAFCAKFPEAEIPNHIDEIIAEFEKCQPEWARALEFYQDCTSYVNSIICYAHAISQNASLQRAENLQKIVDEFESYSFSHHGHREALFLYMGIIWNKLGSSYKENALAAFKKYIFYLLGMSSHTAYSPICYAFKSCKDYVFDGLHKETFGVTSPTKFNDPFDCPILALLDPQDEIAVLIREAYMNCVKIGCFISNVKQPYQKEPGNLFGEIVRDEPKSVSPISEYQNELMWAHYGDCHRGICIKYHFPNVQTNLYSEPSTKTVCYFQDVEYKTDLNVLAQGNGISIKDAFFAKSKAWEYENELRFLHCSLEGPEDYDNIPAPNCIEAIYFGVKCSDDDKRKILDILKDKKLKTTIRRHIDGKGTVTEETLSPIKFFQMEFDKTRFGLLSAKEIQDV